MPERGRNQEDKPATWWVETRPWTCARWVAPLAQEIQLACDAGAACTIAPDQRSASRRATLVCSSDDHWTLEARDGSGRILWTLALDGPHEDRLRQAGVWVARSDMPDLPPLPADAPPPPVTLPPELDEPPAPPAEPAPTAPAATPAPAPSPASPAASDRPPAAHPSASSEPTRPGWFALSASATVGWLHVIELPTVASPIPSPNGTALMGGLQGAAIAHSTQFYGGLSVGYEHSLTNLEGSTESLWRPGAVLGWGAPYGDGWLGLSATVGAAFLSVSQSASQVAGASATPSAMGVGDPTTPTKPQQTQDSATAFFAGLAVHAKLPLVFGQQPFVSLSGSSVSLSRGFSPGTRVGLDLGVVWND